MSKYNLIELLSEVKGGRIGTLNITAMDLERKMEELEGEGIKISTFDGDNFGKTYIEYHVHPENKYDPDESFSIYDYKFGEDPTDIDNVDKEYPFSIGGMSAAINSAKALLGAGQVSYSIEEGEAVDLAIEASQEKAGIEVDESFNSLAKKLDKQKGITKDEAGKIAGKIANIKRKGGGKGPTAKQKKRMNEVRIDRDVAERIEGMLSIPLKRKFLDSFMDLWQNLIEEDPFYAEDVINHLNNEMHKEIDGYQAAGDKLADIEIDEIPMFKGTRDALDDISIREDSTTEYTLDSIAQDEFFGKNYDELDPQQQKYVRSELEIAKGFPFSAGIDQDGARLPEFPDPMKNMKEDNCSKHDYKQIDPDGTAECTKCGLRNSDPSKTGEKVRSEGKGVDFIRALKVDANGTSMEIKSYLESLKRSGDKFDSVDDYVEDFKNYVADKALQEHFGRFMKDYQ